MSAKSGPEDSDDDGFPKHGGEALQIDNDFDDSEEEKSEDGDGDEDEEEMQNRPAMQISNVAKPPPAGPDGKPADVKGQKVENQPFDLAVDVNDSEEIDSDEEEDEVNVDVNVNESAQAKAAQQQKKSAQQQLSGQAPKEEDEEDDEEKEVPGAYNPAQYANLQVSTDVREVFEYINRYKPQKIDLETKIKPFIPDYIPAVGEVDAFLKMPKPDGTKEDLGITMLDEPALNHEDKTVLELKYVQSKNVARVAPIDVDAIENADKKPKEISRWISSVQDLHKTRPPPTVVYSKNMPDIETLMQEWNPEMEAAFKQIPFPGSEIDMHVSDYAKLICAMCDIPVHKSAKNNTAIESLHVLFTLFSEFRSNQHFQQQVNETPGSPGQIEGQENFAQF